VPTRLEIAVGGNQPPVEQWRRSGWSVVDSTSVSRTLDDYRAYIQGSRGEFSVAKNIYTETRSGWFSCRSVCYLASGRPAVLQDTGWSDLVPAGEGLLAFDDPGEAVRAIQTVENDYESHSAAAAKVAAEVFSSDAVLGEMLERCEVG